MFRAQQLRNHTGVGVLDRRREPFQHGPLHRVVRLGELVLGGHHPRELSTGAAQAAVDRRGRRAQQLRHVGGRPLQHVPHDQHRALPGGQVLQRRDKGQPDTGPRGRDGRRVLQVRSDQRVGQRLQPRHLRRHLQRRLRVSGRPAQTGRQRPAAAPLDRGQAHIGRDPIQPSPHRRPALEPLIRPPRPQERLLDQVLGLIHRTHHPVTVSQQLTAEPAGQTGEILADRHQPLQFVRRPATCRPSTYRPDDRRRIAAHPRPAHDLPLGPRLGTARAGMRPRRPVRHPGRARLPIAGGRGVRDVEPLRSAAVAAGGVLFESRAHIPAPQAAGPLPNCHRARAPCHRARKQRTRNPSQRRHPSNHLQ